MGHNKNKPTFVHSFAAAIAPFRRGEGECWIWTARRNHQGYGWFSVGDKNVLAHRRSYEVFVGPIPEGYFVCHHCDTPLCINPAHLFVGTPRDNSLDMSRKKRCWNPMMLANRAKTHCKRGHEFTPENTRTFLNRNGAQSRACRACAALAAERSYDRVRKGVWRKGQRGSPRIT